MCIIIHLPLYLYWTQHILCHPCVAQYLYFDSEIYWVTNKSNIHIDLIQHSHVILQSYSIKRPKDISFVIHEGQISSRILMTLNMISQLALSQLYYYHMTNNVWITVKHFSPYIRILVVSGLIVVYIIFTIRISYDTFITYYVVFSWWVNLV